MLLFIILFCTCAYHSFDSIRCQVPIVHKHTEQQYHRVQRKISHYENCSNFSDTTHVRERGRTVLSSFRTLDVLVWAQIKQRVAPSNRVRW